MTFIHKLMVMHGNGINGLRQFWALILISFFGLQGVMAVEVTYVGKEVGDGSSSYVVQNWSLTSVGKQFNTPSGQERYGTAGYYQIRPTLDSSLEVSEIVSSGNDLGQTAGSEATLSSPPLFLSSITGGAGTLINSGGYSTYLGSDGTTVYRQGGLSVPVGNGPHDSPAGADASYFGEVLQFTLGANAKFRIGLAVDSVGTANHGPGIYSPDYVSIYNNATGSVFSSALTRDGNPDMVFFDIQGIAGDSFTVGLWQNTGSQSVAVLSLVTFDHQTLSTISYVGNEVGGSNNSSNAVRNWSDPSVAKQFNAIGVERYGNAGYYQIRPTLSSAPLEVSEVVPSGNDLGQAAATETTLSFTPAFLSSITGGAGAFVNFGGYPSYLGNDGSTEYRQGGLSVSVVNGPYDSPAGTDASYFGEVLQFTLDETAKFRIGLAVDSVADANYAPNYVGIYNASTGSVFSAALTRDGTPDMVFFDITGNAGDTFTIALWQNTGSRSVAVLSLVTFDEIQSDTTPPVIELNGAASVSVAWGGSYNDSGASVSDNVDASRTISGIGSVNTSKPGVYTLTFDATDAAGNPANQVIRTVTVSAPSSTTEADGLSELMRYALGGNVPGDSVAKPVSTVTGGYLVITAIVRTDDSNLTVVGESVTNLGNYASGTSVVEVQGVDAADQGGVPVGSKRRTFSVGQGSDTKKFLRLKTSLAQ
jgi:hypothetical protein